MGSPRVGSDLGTEWHNNIVKHYSVIKMSYITDFWYIRNTNVILKKKMMHCIFVKSSIFFAVKCLYMPVFVGTLVFKHGERYEIFILIKINLR